MGRQASVLAVREISEKYWAPLGVWVVREVARQVMRSDPMRFSNLNDALAEMARRISTPMAKWRSCSKLAAGTTQACLADFP
jgi:DNA repair protein NreA